MHSCLRTSLLQCASIRKCLNTTVYRDFKTVVKKGPRYAEKVRSDTPREGNMFKGFIKSCAFTGVFCTGTFVAVSIWQYEDRKFRIDGFKLLPRYKYNDFRQKMNRWWNTISDGEKVFWSICSINVAVCLAWRIPRLTPFMSKYFASSPAAKAVCIPLLLSAFSHYSFIHLGLNMAAFHSFSSSMGYLLGKEQMVGFYLSAAVFSGLVSNGGRIMQGYIGYSLGASGALLALIALFCCQNPDARLGILFIPHLEFSAKSAIIGIMTFDTLGLIFRWRIFDHAAHLGGALFGVLYSLYGNEYVWRKRQYVIRKWAEFRNK